MLPARHDVATNDACILDITSQLVGARADLDAAAAADQAAAAAAAGSAAAAAVAAAACAVAAASEVGSTDPVDAALDANGRSPEAKLDLVQAALAELRVPAAAGGARSHSHAPSAAARADAFMAGAARILMAQVAEKAVADLSLEPTNADVAARRSPPAAQVTVLVTAVVAMYAAAAAARRAEAVSQKRATAAAADAAAAWAATHANFNAKHRHLKMAVTLVVATAERDAAAFAVARLKT